MTPRQLIPDNKIIVIFDTSPVRDLAFESIQPPWVKTFVEMTFDGYSFSLSDAAVAELLNQVRTGSTALAAHEQALKWVSTFLNPEVRVLPGGIDLKGMIGEREDWNIHEARYISKVAWETLLDPLKPDLEGRRPLDELLEEARHDWKTLLQRLRHISVAFGLDVAKVDPELALNYLFDIVASGFDRKSNVSPPLSVRLHLALNYQLRQYIRTERIRAPYNPAAKKKKNDGIDVSLYDYLMLPALVVANDGGFYGSLEDISSFQKSWFVPPEQLAREWLAGNRPGPKWPEATVGSEDEADTGK